MIVPDLHELLLSVVHVREIVNHLARLDLQPLRIRPIAWQNKKWGMLRMRSTLLMWIFNYSGSCIKHGEIKTGVCCACTGFFLLIFNHSGIRPKASRNKNVSVFQMCKIFLLMIFSHPGSGLKNAK
jgi:hypothetical protein